jgi:ECF sigma factor
MAMREYAYSGVFRFGGSISVSNGVSVTQWLHGIKVGEGADIQHLWDRYFRRLVRLAGAKLPSHCRRTFDEEDVAIIALRKLKGHTAEEIGAELGTSTRTIDRKLRLIHAIWE